MRVQNKFACKAFLFFGISQVSFLMFDCRDGDSLDDVTEGHSGEEEAMQDEEEVLGEDYMDGGDHTPGDGDDPETGLDEDDEDDREQITVEINGEEFVVNKMEESLL